MFRPFVSLLLLTLIWAGIYLPALGEPELKGEEPRRIMPGLHMLQSGDWLHTTLGATPYFRKPPLVNWAIAGSVAATGQYSEFAYRLPSVLAVLALVLGSAAFTWRWLGAGGAFLAGVFMLTNISMVEKGRLAEIEAIYIACSGLAIACWLAAFARGESGWRQWLWPGLFLGLGMLAKAPLHLIYFYAVVLGACWSTREWKTLRHPAHFICIALTLGIFALWAVPYAASGGSADGSVDTSEVSAAWITQLTSRLGLDDFKWKDWLLNMPRGVMNLLPWALFFPLLWSRHWLDALEDDRERALVRGARNGVVVAFVLISMMPGSLERYTLPLLVPMFLLLALVMLSCATSEDGTETAPRYRPWAVAWLWCNRLLVPLILALGIGGLIWMAKDELSMVKGSSLYTILIALVCLVVILAQTRIIRITNSAVSDVEMLSPDSQGATTGLAVVAVMMLLAAFIVPYANRFDDLRPVRQEVLQHVPAGSTLWVQDVGWRPFWVYLEPEARFFVRTKDAPFGPEELRVLVKGSAAERFLRDSRFKTRPGRVVHTFQDKEGDQFALLQFPSRTDTTTPED